MMDTSKGGSERRIVAAAGVIILFLAGMLFSMGVSHAQTQPGIDVKVQPALFEQTINPGDQFSTSITVTNSGSASQQFTIGVQDISGVNDGGEPLFTTSTATAYSVSSWVALGKTIITVPAGGSVAVPFTITVPANAQPGGHYGAIFVSSGATRPSLNGSGLGYDVGALIELRIAGNATEQAEIKEFSTDKSLYQTPDVTFTASVANEGNVLLQPRGPIDITNMFGQKVGTVILNDQGASIFPGAQRSFTATWSGGGFAFGQFSAVTTLNYGDAENMTVSASTSFWIIPIIPIAAVLASIIFFILIFVWAVRAYVRKRVSQMIGSAGGHERSSMSEEEKLLSGGGLPMSRLVFLVIATAIFALVFLLILLFFFG
jgi:hypothetical protein